MKTQVLETLHHHRSQSDVTIDLQGGNVLEVREAVVVVLGLHPVYYNPVEALLTTDGQLKEKKKKDFLSQSHMKKICISAQ